jgi:hypothetical protein
MWSSYFLVACGVLLEVANILWNRAGRSSVLLIPPILTFSGIWQFDLLFQIKILITVLVFGLHSARVVWGRQQIAEMRKSHNEG